MHVQLHNIHLDRQSDKKNKNVTLKKVVISAKLVLVDTHIQDLLKVEREFH